MLVLTRKIGETILIGDDIEITVTRFERNAVRLAIKAPPSVKIYRGELYRALRAALEEEPAQPSPDSAP